MADVAYKAFSVDDRIVTVVAFGNDPTPGYKHYFEDFSDGLKFITEAPSGTVAQVITPFFTFGFIHYEGGASNCPLSVNVYDESGNATVVQVSGNVDLTKLLGDSVGNG